MVWHEGTCQSATDLQCSAILPGAFNPVHHGHWQLLDAAASFLGCPVVFELSIDNVDKPVLCASEVHRRLRQIPDNEVLLTYAALFTTKARLFPGCWFVVGFDTAERVLDSQYYDQDVRQRDQSLRDLNSANVKFLVAGRVNPKPQSAAFLTCDQLAVDHDYAEMFVELPESCFRADISSTAIRKQQATGLSP